MAKKNGSTAAVLTLDEDEIQLILQYRSTDDECQDDIRRIVTNLRSDFPRRIVPSLRLIVGGTK